MGKYLRQAWDGNLRAYCFLTMAFMLMALNVIVGRAAHTEIPPLGLSFWRWLLASFLFLPFAFGKLREQWPLVLANWKVLLVVSIVMVPLGNNLIYVGLQDTTALNGGLIPVARPVLILSLSWFLFRGTVTRYQWLGIAIAMTGVITVLTRGDPAILAQMDFNRGDLWLVGASIGIACYQTLIGRVTQDLHPVVLLQITMILGAVLMLPPYIVETLAGRPVIVTAPALGAIVFCAVFPSICAVYLINAGIAALGPARMGIFNYLPPLFVAAIAIPVLGEELHWYHLVAFALVTLGIVTSVRARKKGKNSDSA
jgi:drug/metabolite transporter (DMT)-like permease